MSWKFSPRAPSERCELPMPDSGLLEDLLLLLLLFLLDFELVTILQVTFVILALVACYEAMSALFTKDIQL